MRNVFILSACLALLLSSCVMNTLNPLVTAANAIRVEGVTGQWKDREGTIMKVEALIGSALYKRLAGDKKQEWQPAEKKYWSNTYLLTYTQEDVQHFCLLNFARFGKSLIMQCTPFLANDTRVTPSDKEPDGDMIWGPDRDQTYSFYKVDAVKDGWAVRGLNAEKMEELVGKGRIAIPVEKDALFGTTLVTASSAQLQQFFMKYSQDERLFDKTPTLVLQAVQP